LNNLYLCHFLNSDFGKNKMLSLVGGVAITRLTLTKINQAVIHLPSIDIQKQIVTDIEKEQKSIDEVIKLIEIHELKIKDKISEVWGE
jgi:type I restriction enzyme, S subunit